MGKFLDALFGGAPDFILGGASNLVSNGINYAFQQMTAQQNYQLAEQAAEKQYQRQLDFWERQNAYNHPRSQVNRRLAAGLSPVESVDSGNASQLSSVPGNNVAQNGALQFQSSIDLLQSMRTVQDIRNLGKTGSKLDAELSNLLIEGMLLDLEKKLKDAGLKDMAERLRGLVIQNDREERANKYLYTEQYYKDMATNLANSNWLQGMDITIKEADIRKAQFAKMLYDEYGITPEILSQLISAGSNLVGDVVNLGTDFIRNKFFPKKVIKNVGKK